MFVLGGCCSALLALLSLYMVWLSIMPPIIKKAKKITIFKNKINFIIYIKYFFQNGWWEIEFRLVNLVQFKYNFRVISTKNQSVRDTCIIWNWFLKLVFGDVVEVLVIGTYKKIWSIYSKKFHSTRIIFFKYIFQTNTYT